MKYISNAKYFFLKTVRTAISILLRYSISAKFSDFLIWPVFKRLFGNYEEVVHIGGNIRLRVYGDMEDMVNKTLLFMSGFLPFAWEPVTARLVIFLADKVKCAVVAGAHIGYYPLLLTKTNPRTKVYAFEPNPFIYDRLLDNLELNRASGVVPTCAALGDVPGRKNMYFDFGQSSLIETGRRHAGSGEVEVDTLDEMFKSENILPDLMILDAEGYEPRILAGAVLILDHSAPDVIFEINPKALRAAGSSSEGLCSIFSSRGYSIFIIEDVHSIRVVSGSDLSVKLSLHTGSLSGGVSFVNAFATMYPERLKGMIVG